MSIQVYLESSPLYEISVYKKAVPQDAVPFIGSPRKHPYEKEKCILVHMRKNESPLIIEFKLADIINVEETKTEVDDTGKSLYLVRLWIRRGAHATVHTPFKVGDPQFLF